MMHIINGKEVAQSTLLKLETMIRCIEASLYRAPKLHVYRVGEHPASMIYTQNKLNTGRKIGMDVEIIALPEEITEDALMHLIKKDNNDPKVDGLIVQLPLPDQLDAYRITNAIVSHKDVDGLTDGNLGGLVSQSSLLKPCTPLGILELLKSIHCPLRGLDALVIGKSCIVGKPLALSLMSCGCTVTVAHKATKQLKEKVQASDLVVSAIGNPNVIQPQWFKKHAIVIDVGINRLDHGAIVGDVDYQQCKQAGFVTPVPGGVGPMTVAMLIKNTVLACCHQHDLMDLYYEHFGEAL
ncbi:MAG: bifunctional methylenetetrahydrofolate dehydrogenase/methenyltetrahydrofolate cyclohydrolase [Legionellales bacterium]|nr:bifunctional methylenetetrahydrofolate dehydrogenase/methenyltetrahydrofolate cyclohydrolase [Legionellales bacterium]OUX67699.1 MAG: hypothetical protein CBD38_01645 [bacterium TMED178]|tara:strand:- start:650 stop:1537 length:888 start_codon:yes stop_codon:yes gene_type:complete